MSRTQESLASSAAPSSKPRRHVPFYAVLGLAVGLAVGNPAAAAECWAAGQEGNVSAEEGPTWWDVDWIDVNHVDPHEDDGGFRIVVDRSAGASWVELQKSGAIIRTRIADNGAILVPPPVPLHLWLDLRSVGPEHRSDFADTVVQCWPSSIPGAAVQTLLNLIDQ